MTVYLVDVEAHDGTSLRTLHFGTTGITTRPNDSPSNAYYDPRIMDPGNLERTLFASGTTRGRSQVGVGDVTLASGDPGNRETLDALLDYGFDGRRITIKTLPDTRTPVAAARVLFRGTCDQLAATDVLERLSLRIRDRLADLDRPLLTLRYAGTTTGPGPTAEGNVDLKDQVKPWIWGRALNVPCTLANPFDLLYQVSGGAVSAIVVYDAGVALADRGDHPTLAALRAAALVPGQYATCRALGVFRLGGAPFQSVTADVTEGASAADRTAAQVARRMLLHHGVDAADLPPATFAALDALNPAEVGIRVADQTTALDAVTQVLGSIGGWLISTRTGAFEVGRFGQPAGSPVALFDETSLMGDSGVERLATGDDGRGIPAYRVTVRYARVWQVQGDGDLAGNVPPTRRAALATEYREARAEAPGVLVKHPSSPEITVDTLLLDEAAALAEAQRLLALYSVRRDRYRLSVPVSEGEVAELGRSVAIDLGRAGLDGARPFAVIGRTDEYAENSITLDVWG